MRRKEVSRLPVRGQEQRRTGGIPLQIVLVFVLAIIVGAGVLAGHLHHQAPLGASRTTTTLGAATVNGTVVSHQDTDPTCASGANGVRSGAAVEIVDANQALVASVTLGPGEPAFGGGCQWPWQATLPPSSHYQVLVAQLRPVSVTRQQLAAAGWRFTVRDGP